MVLDLESRDATILQFAPDFQVEVIRPKVFRPPKDWSNRGEMTRIVPSILRRAAEPLTTRDITLELVVERCWKSTISGRAAERRAGKAGGGLCISRGCPYS